MEIETLRRQLALLKSLSPEITQRDHLAEKLYRNKELLEQKTLDQHRYESYRPHQAKKLAEEILLLRGEITTLEEQIRTLDQLLEGIDDDPAEALSAVRTVLITEILSRCPEAQKEYSILNQQLSDLRTLNAELARFQELIATFSGYLHAGMETTRRRSLLEMLLGRHPKALLASAIEKGAREGREILKHLDTFPQEKELYAQFRSFLEDFLKDAEKAWNQSLYNKRFLELFAHFSTLTQSLENERTRTSTSIEAKERALDLWIERYATRE